MTDRARRGEQTPKPPRKKNRFLARHLRERYPHIFDPDGNPHEPDHPQAPRQGPRR